MLNVVMKKSCIGMSGFVAGVALLMAGCGGGGGPTLFSVTGPVSLDGKPIEEGRITFKSKDTTKNSFSAPIAGGTYDMKAEAGDYKVEITASRVIPGKFDTTSNPGFKEPLSEMYIPKQYNSATTLTATVDGSKSMPFELKSK